MKKAILITIACLLIAFTTACYISVKEGSKPPCPTKKTSMHMKDGKEYPMARDSVIMSSPDGKKWRLTIDNDGQVQTDPVE